MGRIFRPLREMGANITGSDTDTPPIRIKGCRLRGIDYTSPVASAQIKSCVLLAGLFAEGKTRVQEPEQSRDHTERMLPLFGVELAGKCTVKGGGRLRGAEISIPADVSSAAFPIAAAVLLEDSEVLLSNIGVNPTRDGFLRALKEMGADISYIVNMTDTGEPASDICVRSTGRLKAIDLPESWVPSMVDEIPILMVVAALSDGITRIRGASELRVKESDRLQVMGDGLRALGITVVDYPDGVDIHGTDKIGMAELESAQDHRCAMSFAVLGLRASEKLQIRDAEYIATSYPGFIDDMNSLGTEMRMVNF
jgi:3-phosphoshikimate 1-carboxyvinyltransferase